MASRSQTVNATSSSVVQPPAQFNSKPITAKLVLLGESAVGKSCLVNRFVNNSYDDGREATITPGHETKLVPLRDRTIKLDIWDTAGQERFDSLAPHYYRNAEAAIIVYDITKNRTMAKAKSWVNALQRDVGPNIVIALVGNKLDLVEDEDDDERSISSEHSERQVPEEDAREYADAGGFLFMETSAKTSQNVNDLFIEIARRIPIPSQDPQFQLNLNITHAATEPRAGSRCTC